MNIRKEIDKLNTELNALLEKYNAKLYTEIKQDYSGVQDCELKIDFPKTHGHTIFSINESIDFLSDKDQCTECGEILLTENEIDYDICTSCSNEIDANEVSFQEQMTENWNNR